MEQMKASSPEPLDLRVLEIDLQNLKSVEEGAKAFMRQESRLDLLVNNAGVCNPRLLPRHSLCCDILEHTNKPHIRQVMSIPFKLTTDGFETHWQTNHLAPFLLTKTLLPILESTATSSNSKDRVRIINVASDAALLRPTPKQLDLAHPNLEYLTGSTSVW